MSILVRGMEMPESCSRCVFRHLTLREYSFCMAGGIDIEGINEKKERPAACPLVEVEEFEVWPNLDQSRKFNILKTKGGMHFMGPNGPVDPPKGD